MCVCVCVRAHVFLWPLEVNDTESRGKLYYYCLVCVGEREIFSLGVPEIPVALIICLFGVTCGQA